MLFEVQARIKIAGRNVNNLRYADDTTLFIYLFIYFYFILLYNTV